MSLFINFENHNALVGFQGQIKPPGISTKEIQPQI